MTTYNSEWKKRRGTPVRECPCVNMNEYFVILKWKATIAGAAIWIGLLYFDSIKMSPPRAENERGAPSWYDGASNGAASGFDTERE